jgi:hypothetical protein
MEDKSDAHLSRDQEDKLVLLRTLQGVLYTTKDKSLTNLLSKYEYYKLMCCVSIFSTSIVITDHCVISAYLC